MTHPIVQAQNNLDGAIDSYEFLKRTFKEHLDTMTETEERVLEVARENIAHFEKQLKEVAKQLVQNKKHTSKQ